MAELIKILLVDDQQLIRDGISALLALQEGITIAGSVSDGREAVDFLKENDVDVALMDIRMPGMDGITATELIKQDYPGVLVIMLTTFDDEEYIIRSLQAGACGYLLKDIPTNELAQAVRLAFNGIFQLSSTAIGKLVDEKLLKLPDRPENNQKFLSNLTQRETEILDLIATGATNKEIADQLFISIGTVKNHVSRILAGINARDRVAAAIVAIRHGLGGNRKKDSTK
ncbi:MAG: response regulator transcription factor [Chloroflexota bacterium]